MKHKILDYLLEADGSKFALTDDQKKFINVLVVLAKKYEGNSLELSEFKKEMKALGAKTTPAVMDAFDVFTFSYKISLGARNVDNAGKSRSSAHSVIKTKKVRGFYFGWFKTVTAQKAISEIERRGNMKHGLYYNVSDIVAPMSIRA